MPIDARSFHDVLLIFFCNEIRSNFSHVVRGRCHRGDFSICHCCTGGQRVVVRRIGSLVSPVHLAHFLWSPRCS